jgi:hypothetical protein
VDEEDIRGGGGQDVEVKKTDCRMELDLASHFRFHFILTRNKSIAHNMLSFFLNPVSESYINGTEPHSRGN